MAPYEIPLGSGPTGADGVWCTPGVVVQVVRDEPGGASSPGVRHARAERVERQLEVCAGLTGSPVRWDGRRHGPLLAPRSHRVQARKSDVRARHGC